MRSSKFKVGDRIRWRDGMIRRTLLVTDYSASRDTYYAKEPGGAHIFEIDGPEAKPAKMGKRA